MALVTHLVIIFALVIVLGALIFQILPRLFPKIRKSLPSQSFISYTQIVPIMFMFASLAWLFFSRYLQSHVGEDAYYTLRGWAHIIFVVYEFSVVIFNYLCAVFIKPGYPQTQEEFAKERSFVKRYEICIKCRKIRNFGTHHCSWCNTCVRMMCHHCPFTNNCVGLKNYVYYYTFLGYAFFGMAYASYLAYFPFISCYQVVGANQLSSLLNHPDFTAFSKYTGIMHKINATTPEMCEEMGEYIILLAPVVVVTVFMGLLFGFQSLLLVSDLSIVDFYETIGRSNSVMEFFKTLSLSIRKKKKSRFWLMVYQQKSRWWKFFLPSYIDVEVEKLNRELDM